MLKDTICLLTLMKIFLDVFNRIICIYLAFLGNSPIYNYGNLMIKPWTLEKEISRTTWVSDKT